MMKSQEPRGGRIINTGSVSSHVPRPDSAPYTATKHGVTGLTRSISLDGRKYDIACGQIDVGNALTEMSARIATGVKQANGEMAPEPMMDVQNIADAVVLMAGLPIDCQRAVHDDHGDQDALHRAGLRRFETGRTSASPLTGPILAERGEIVGDLEEAAKSRSPKRMTRKIDALRSRGDSFPRIDRGRRRSRRRSEPGCPQRYRTWIDLQPLFRSRQSPPAKTRAQRASKPSFPAARISVSGIAFRPCSTIRSAVSRISHWAWRSARTRAR